MYWGAGASRGGVLSAPFFQAATGIPFTLGGLELRNNKVYAFEAAGGLALVPRAGDLGRVDPLEERPGDLFREIDLGSLARVGGVELAVLGVELPLLQQEQGEALLLCELPGDLLDLCDQLLAALALGRLELAAVATLILRQAGRLGRKPAPPPFGAAIRPAPAVRAPAPCAARPGRGRAS